MAAEVADITVPCQDFEQPLAFVEVDPHTQVEAGVIDRDDAVVAGKAAEAFVDLDQQAIALA
ncbi:hypothetical protein D3C76_1784510 [compost metagenome]